MKINYAKASQYFRVLGNPTRVAIVSALCRRRGRMTNQSMLNFLDVPKANLSQHLYCLCMAGICRTEKIDGTTEKEIVLNGDVASIEAILLYANEKAV